MTATTATLVSTTPPPASLDAVAFDGVSRRFGDTLALDDVALGISTGETVALLGPNGAGKTTAIGIMLGLLEPSAGRARTLGLEPRDAVRSGRVGAMLQSAGLPPGARVGELVDDGVGRPGNGIAGLRERASGLGGSVEAGPLPNRGFRLRVSVPVPDRAAAVS